MAEQELAAERIIEGNSQELAIALIICAEAYTLVGRMLDATAVLHECIKVSNEFGLADQLAIAYDWLIGVSLDTASLKEARANIGHAYCALEQIGIRDRSSPVFLYLRDHSAQLAFAEGRCDEALRLARPLEQCLHDGSPRTRARLLAVHLGARLQLGSSDQVEAIAEGLCSCFDEPNYWLDWPATVYAHYLERFRGREAAARFARWFVSDIRREANPAPASLLYECGAPAFAAAVNDRRALAATGVVR